MKKKLSSIATSLMLTTSLCADMPMMNFMETVDWEFMGDKTEFTLDLCQCDNGGGDIGAGLRARLAEPVGTIETTNTPWNIVGLGMKVDESPGRKEGNSRGQDEGEYRRYTHSIAFAPLGVLNFVQDAVCFERMSGASFLYWSEIIPTQTNDVIAVFTQASKGPLSKIWYNNPVGVMACTIDCAQTTFSESNNTLHWCAGCAGVTGNNTAYGAGKEDDPITSHHVFALSAIDDLHYAGVFSNLQRSASFPYSPVSKVANSMCEPTYMPLAIKTQYRLNLGGMPTTWDATRIGDFRAKWAEFKNRPNTHDDVMTWLWTLKDTCVGASKCKSFFTKEAN
jgi:conjugal transfer pilus assembly protein TraU